MQTSFSPGLNKGDKVIFGGRIHTIAEITFEDPCQTGVLQKYCKCVCDQWGGVYVLSESTLLKEVRSCDRDCG